MVTVIVGQQISWTNQGKQEHIVRAKSVEAESGFATGTLQPGDSFTVTLPEPDTYTYDCSADGSLTGTITVEP
jgi:plastocyanin